MFTRQAMRRVVVESPYKAETELKINQHILYAQACILDCLLRGEAPIASHLLYTQVTVLNDNIPYERQLGIDAGFAWLHVADGQVVYIDLGISSGMELAMTYYEKIGGKPELRTLGGNLRMFGVAS